MSELDDRVKRSLEAAARDWQADTARNRSAVHQKVVRTRIRRRRRSFLVAAAALVILALAIWAGASTGLLRGLKVSPIGKPPHTRTLPQPFRVAASFDPASLGLSHPLDLAVAPSGNIYVTDRNQRVTEISPGGRVLARWGHRGTGPGEFRMDSGSIAVAADGRVFVADTGNFRVQVFSATGRHLASLGSFGRGAGQFVWPSTVVAGAGGSVYVADDNAATVTKLSASGRQEWRVGDTATRDPDLVGHEHLGGLDAYGRLVMANDDAGRVVYLTAAGHKVAAFGSGASGGNESGSHPTGGDFPGGACGATTDSRGDVYVNSCEESTSAHHDTEIYDARHRLIAAWKRGPLTSSPYFLPDGRAVSLDSQGDVLVLDVHLP